MTVKIQHDSSCFSTNSSSGKLNVRVSSEPNNGISMDSNGHLIVTRGLNGKNGVGGTMNLPGNGIDGTVDEAILSIRCNNSVSRLTLTDPDPNNEGLLITDIITHILNE